MSSDVTMLGEMEKVVGHLRSSYNQGVTQSYEWRIAQMQGVLNLIKNHKQELIEVLAKDGGKSVFEADLFEVTPIAAEAETVIANLKSWMAPTKVETPIILLPGSNEVHHESYGVILVIAPYNYPLQLACVPMLSALAAGNCVLLKPSEMTPHTSALLAKLIPQYLDPRAIQVVLGGIPETTAILAQRFDMIFFTGSAHVGKIVHQAAAKHLTPCVLELGGKTPVIVDKTVTDLKLAARRLMWGKMANAGQTCIAPDYVLIHKDIRREFVDLCVEWVKDFYTETPKKCTDFARVNNRRTVERLKSLLDEPEKIVFGGDVDADELYVAPTLIDNVSLESKVMEEEIFGPLMPFLEVEDMEEAIRIARSKPKPLALYIFSNDTSVVDHLISQIPSGGVCVNDTLMHFVTTTLPFGGVGASGMGCYHGKWSFETFTHKRAVSRRAPIACLDIVIRYAPYTNFRYQSFKFLAEYFHMYQVPADFSKSARGCFVMPSKCQYEEESTGHRCTKDASYGEPGQTLRQRCKEHAFDTMVPVHARPTCQVQGCKKKASCGYTPPEDEADAKEGMKASSQKKLVRCLDHALEGMVRVKYETPCHATGCHKKRKFGQPPDGPAIFCGDHREKGMDNVFKRAKKRKKAGTTTVPPVPDPEGRVSDGLPLLESASPLSVVQTQTVGGHLLSPPSPPTSLQPQQEPGIVEGTVERTTTTEIPDPAPLASLPSPPPIVSLSFFGHPLPPPPPHAAPPSAAMSPFQMETGLCEPAKETDALSFPIAAPSLIEGSGGAVTFSPRHLATNTMTPLLETTHSRQVEVTACSPTTSPPSHYLSAPPHHASMFTIQEYPMDLTATHVLQSPSLMTTMATPTPPPSLLTSVPQDCPPSMIAGNVPLGLPIPTNTAAMMIPAVMISGVGQQQTEEERLAKRVCLDDRSDGGIDEMEKGEGWLDTLATAAMTANKLDLSSPM